MKYGYTIANNADNRIFAEMAEYIENSLHYKRDDDATVDVDGSMFQHFSSDDNHIKLESDMETDYVGVVSDVPITINCLREWTL